MNDSSLDFKTQQGMPKGIPFIIGNEAAERFSYYGMKAILTIFMVNYLHMTDSESTAWYHNFGSAVYALPLLGALISDFFLGKYRTILWLSIVYCLGHLVLALNESREGLYWGLCLIAFGSGGIKPCVSAHVGDQFDKGNQHLVNKVFSIFYFAINFGSFFSTLLIPYLLENYGPQIAFGLPGLLMFLATFVFWLGRKEFIHIPARPKLLLQEIRTKSFLFLALRLGLIYLFISVFWALYDQTGSSWVIQASTNLMDKHVNLGFIEFEVLSSQIQAINPILVMILVPIFSFFLYPWINKFFTFKPLLKICVGMFLCALSFYVIGLAEADIYAGNSTSIWWQLLAYFILTAGEVLLSLTALEYSYTQAPVSLKSIVMGLYLLSVSLGNFTTSFINKFIINDLYVNKIEVSSNVFIHTNTDFQSGDKINLNKNIGLLIDKEYDEGEIEDTLSGTFVLRKQTQKRYVLCDINRIPVKVKKDKSFAEDQSISGAFSSYTLNGPAYFNFFALFMLITSVLFIPFAFLLKDKSYFQE